MKNHLTYSNPLLSFPGIMYAPRGVTLEDPLVGSVEEPFHTFSWRIFVPLLSVYLDLRGARFEFVEDFTGHVWNLCLGDIVGVLLVISEVYPSTRSLV